jgi:hypothetical protein
VPSETKPDIHHPTRPGSPENFPDSESNGRQVIYAHGFNVNEQQSRSEIAEAFKRLWQSGSRAMFTGVSWYGSQGQKNTYIPGIGLTSADYHINVRNAFLTAPYLAGAVANLPGAHKFAIAHSLGNMLVSSAIVDHKMGVENYFAIDAAVAMEAYDGGTLKKDDMVNPGHVGSYHWTDYDRHLWASEWYQLFSPEKGFADDGRHGLTWRDRFGAIPNMYNFYSSGEEVLENSTGSLPALPKPWPFDANNSRLAWVSQEMRKGTFVINLVTEKCQAGWVPNGYWDVTVPQTGKNPIKAVLPPEQANALTDDDLRQEPFFQRFLDKRLRDPALGSDAAKEPQLRAEVLGAGIPALSLATGANSADAFHPLNSPDRNIPLMSFETGWPTVRPLDSHNHPRWLHSDLKAVAYPYNHKLHEKLVELGGLKNEN